MLNFLLFLDNSRSFHGNTISEKYDFSRNTGTMYFLGKTYIIHTTNQITARGPGCSMS